MQLNYYEDRYNTIIGFLYDGSRVGGDTGPHIGALLGHGAGHSRALHLSLVVDDHSCIIFEINKCALFSSPGLSLSHNHGGVYLLAELGLSLSAGGHDEITHTSRGELIESTLDAVYGDDHQ